MSIAIAVAVCGRSALWYFVAGDLMRRSHGANANLQWLQLKVAGGALE